MNVYKELVKFKSNKFKDFESNLVPTINKKFIIGVKSPYIKKIAKQLYTSGQYNSFINKIPHKYLEENLVHMQVINLIRNYDEAIAAINKLLPYMDNWMITDSIGSKTLNNNKKKLENFVFKCLNSKNPYTIRLGILLLKKYFLDDSFSSKQMKKALYIKTNDYYVKMMQAWYVAEGLLKQNKIFFKEIKNQKLDPFVQNKSIQKAKESFRISNNLKKELSKYKVSYE